MREINRNSNMEIKNENTLHIYTIFSININYINTLTHIHIYTY